MGFRDLIACIDGTWNSGSEGSNVQRIHDALLNDGGRQTALYLTGVGTRGYSDRIIGGLWGGGSTARVRSVYRSICENYEAGDRISLFGFSRGAFAARVVAGLIQRLGILPRDQLHHIDAAISMFWTRRSSAANDLRTFARERRAREAAIHFLGLWDTVVRHGPALAPVAWAIETSLNRRFGLSDQSAAANMISIAHALALDEDRAAFTPWRIRPRTDTERISIEEAWFAGSHSDVGGGYVESRASECSLVWIAERARSWGLVFQDDRLPRPDTSACTAALHPGRRGVWRLLPSQKRIVLESDRLHESVFERMRATGYRPLARIRSQTLVQEAAMRG